jgi:HSP20 family protein
MVVHAAPVSPLGDIWSSTRVRVLFQGRWRPDADVYETQEAIGVVVDLAGVDEDDFEVQLFEDALVVEGWRLLRASADATYLAATVRQGPFRVELALPAPVDADRVEARYERGLLHVTLPRRGRAS